MAEAVDGHAGSEIEVAIAVGCDQPASFAALEGDIGAGKNRKKVGFSALAHGVPR
jgi:hypothetical protein